MRLSLLLAFLLAGCALPQASASAPQCRQPGPPQALPANAPPGSTYLSTALPPAKYRKPVKVEIDFHSPDEVNRICAGPDLVPVCGVVFYACARGNKLTMPYPTEYRGPGTFEGLLLHEMAHANGWAGHHPPE